MLRTDLMSEYFSRAVVFTLDSVTHKYIHTFNLTFFCLNDLDEKKKNLDSVHTSGYFLII